MLGWPCLSLPEIKKKTIESIVIEYRCTFGEGIGMAWHVQNQSIVKTARVFGKRNGEGDQTVLRDKDVE